MTWILNMRCRWPINSRTNCRFSDLLPCACPRFLYFWPLPSFCSVFECNSEFCLKFRRSFERNDLIVDIYRQIAANSIVSLPVHESIMLVDWLVVLGLSALWDSISVYIRPSPIEMEKEKRKIDERKNVQTTPTCTYWKRSRNLPFSNPNL